MICGNYSNSKVICTIISALKLLGMFKKYFPETLKRNKQKDVLMKKIAHQSTYMQQKWCNKFDQRWPYLENLAYLEAIQKTFKDTVIHYWLLCMK